MQKITANILLGLLLITVHVRGMVCGFCAQGISKSFSSIAAVEHVDVSLKEKTVQITLKKGGKLDDTTIQNVLKDSGYDVDKIERVP